MPQDLFTTIAAWVGAIAGPSALFWDYYKWKSMGPRIIVTVVPSMVLTNAIDGPKYVRVIVKNIGTSPTTINVVTLCTYESWLKRKRMKPTKCAVIAGFVMTPLLPYKLEPGCEWSGLVEQDRVFAEWSQTGRLYCEVHHTMMGSKPVQAYVTPPEVPKLGAESIVVVCQFISKPVK